MRRLARRRPVCLIRRLLNVINYTPVVCTLRWFTAPAVPPAKPTAAAAFDPLDGPKLADASHQRSDPNEVASVPPDASSGAT